MAIDLPHYIHYLVISYIIHISIKRKTWLLAMIYQLLILINHSKLETAISIIYVYNMCVFHHCWLYIYIYVYTTYIPLYFPIMALGCPLYILDIPSNIPLDHHLGWLIPIFDG